MKDQIVKNIESKKNYKRLQSFRPFIPIKIYKFFGTQMVIAQTKV